MFVKDLESIRETHQPVITESQPYRQAVLILGMHRSGTSALTGMLVKLGADSPKTLLQPNENNPSGYWESKAFYNFHDAMLESAGSYWYDWRVFNQQWFNSPSADFFKKEWEKIFAEEFGDSQLLAVKDPRICRFVPFWQDLLIKKSIKPKVVLIHRNPLEVAASLKKRNGFSKTYSLLLWLRHVLDAEAATRGMTRSIVSYSDLINDWREVVEQITEELDIKWPECSKSVEKDIDIFISNDLRQNEATSEEVYTGSDIFDWVKFTYQIITELRSRTADTSVLQSQIDQIKQEFDKASAVFSSVVVEAEEEYEQVKSDASELKRKLEIINHNLLKSLEIQKAKVDHFLSESCFKEKQSKNGNTLKTENTIANDNLKLIKALELQTEEVQKLDIEIDSVQQKIIERKKCINQFENYFTHEHKELINIINVKNNLIHTLESKLSKVQDKFLEDELKITEMEHILKNKEIQLSEIQVDLNYNIKKNKDYMNELQHKESELQFKQAEINDYKKELAQLTEWIRELKIDFNMLLTSNNWKFGNRIVSILAFLRVMKKSSTGAGNAHKIFTSFEARSQDRQKVEDSAKVKLPEELDRLRIWLLKLDKNINKMYKTKRYRLSCIAGWFVFATRGRGKKPRSVVNMENIFEQFRRWEPKVSSAGDDIQKFSLWISELQENYSILINSKRWKVANRIVTFLNRIIFRSESKIATNQIQVIFSEFKKWQKELMKMPEIIVKDFDYDAPVSPDNAAGEPYTLLPPYQHQ